MSGLAQMYDLRDEAQAKEYLEKLGIEYRFQCFHEKLPDGCHRLADFMEAFRKDYEKAASVYKENCEKNNYGHSCFKYGHYHMKGITVEKNRNMAAEYYEAACNNQYPSGCYNAGMLYITGKANSKKFSMRSLPEVGAELLKKGCEENDAKCCQRLSTSYINGFANLYRNMEKAFEYGKKACDLGHKYGCVNVSRMYKLGDGVEKNEELAKAYKKRATDLHVQDSPEHSVKIEFQKTS